MEIKLNENLDFEDRQLNEFIKNLNQCFFDKQKYFAKLSFTIYNILNYCGVSTYKKTTTGEYFTSITLLEAFGFDTGSISRYKQSYEKFCQGTTIENVCLKSYFNSFSPSKLFELLPLSYKTLEELIDKKIINSEMTVKQIRAYVKSLKNGEKTSESVIENISQDNEEDIPMAYNPEQSYDFEYFKEKNKSQLLNMIWEKQKAYEKLKDNYNKLKKEKIK